MNTEKNKGEKTQFENELEKVSWFSWLVGQLVSWSFGGE